MGGGGMMNEGDGPGPIGASEGMQSSRDEDIEFSHCLLLELTLNLHNFFFRPSHGKRHKLYQRNHVGRRFGDDVGGRTNSSRT